MKIGDLKKIISNYPDSHNIQVNIEDGHNVTVVHNLEQDTDYLESKENSLVLVVSLDDEQFIEQG